MSRKKLVLTAIVLVLVIAIGGILAYFTDTETKTNRFKMGEVDILVDEPSWPGDPDDPDDKVPVVPNQDTPKDPQVKNNGEGNVYAFVKVTVPVGNVKVGDAETASLTQLFTFRKKTSAAGVTPVTYADGVNTGWTLVSGPTTPLAAGTTEVTYIYAWATDGHLTPIAKNSTTTPVFDAVRFVDATETDSSASGSIQGSDLNVVVKGYGVQAEGLESDVPATVWAEIGD